MKRSLTRKLIVYYLLIACVLFILVNTTLAKIAEKRIFEEQEQTMYAQTCVIMDGYVKRYYDNRISIEKVLESLEPVAEMLDARILIVASWGKVVGDTNPVSDTKVEFEEIAPDFLDKTFHRDVYYQGLTSEPMLAVTVPLTHQYNVKGYVGMMVTMESVNLQVSEAVYEMNRYYLGIMAVLFTVFVGIYIGLVLPLRKTIAAAKAYSMGEFEKKPNLQLTGEFGALSDVIGYMGDTMQRFNEYQREIIANISHDFRSPLTSIKGYAEAIKDGTIPPEQQEKYLALFQHPQMFMMLDGEIVALSMEEC